MSRTSLIGVKSYFSETFPFLPCISSLPILNLFPFVRVQKLDRTSIFPLVLDAFDTTIKRCRFKLRVCVGKGNPEGSERQLLVLVQLPNLLAFISSEAAAVSLSLLLAPFFHPLSFTSPCSVLPLSLSLLPRSCVSVCCEPKQVEKLKERRRVCMTRIPVHSLSVSDQ